MTLLLKQIFSFIQLLNSETGHNQLAAGLACGLILGFAPTLSLQGILVLLVILLFRVQMGAAFLSAFFFKFTAWILDPVSDQIGKGILEQPSLRPLFVELYNMPIVPLTRFNNSVIMGAGVLSLILVIPMFFIFRMAVLKYRVTILARFQKTKLWKLMKATTLYQWYEKYHQLYG